MTLTATNKEMSAWCAVVRPVGCREPHLAVDIFRLLDRQPNCRSDGQASLVGLDREVIAPAPVRARGSTPIHERQRAVTPGLERLSAGPSGVMALVARVVAAGPST